MNHCQLVSQVAAQYKSSATANNDKPAEESKEQSTSPAAGGANKLSSSKSNSSLPSSSSSSAADQCNLYDLLRAEMRAHANGQGNSRKNLAQFFERYLR